MNKTSRIFVQGLAVVAPVAVTAYVVYWLAATSEKLLRRAIVTVVPDEYYVPGLGVVSALVVVFVIGLLVQVWFVRRLVRWGETILDRIPLVKLLYGAMRDMMNFFGSDASRRFHQVVTVSLDNGGATLLGLMTREDFDGLPEDLAGDDEVAVYLPMSYQLGGFTVFVPRARLTRLDMSIEDAIRFAVTAGVSANASRQQGSLAAQRNCSPQNRSKEEHDGNSEREAGPTQPQDRGDGREGRRKGRGGQG
jgi:uncharacterized membrane protein